MVKKMKILKKYIKEWSMNLKEIIKYEYRKHSVKLIFGEKNSSFENIFKEIEDFLKALGG